VHAFLLARRGQLGEIETRCKAACVRLRARKAACVRLLVRCILDSLPPSLPPSVSLLLLRLLLNQGHHVHYTLSTRKTDLIEALARQLPDTMLA
jgi:hypothetical protein